MDIQQHHHNNSLATYHYISTLKAYSSYVFSLTLASKFLYSGSSYREIRIWNHHPPPNNSNPNYTADNNIVAVSNGAIKSLVISWGTGRVVSRIPRVPGGGTHRAGQGVLAICAVVVACSQQPRSGAVGIGRSTLTRSAMLWLLPSLHLLSLQLCSLVATSSRMSLRSLLLSVGAFPDVEKAKDSHAIRPGKGKMRNRRYISHRALWLFMVPKVPRSLR
ncbi:hypothetical protein NE237_003331 [Protea cynaroides]|uniref:Uncharacterized protein n=1 Tax=Protea cynaroides TaxID=273540 RepID=A0A9Q0KGS3_9MAGN|nr:hypothetical protein NE237_003331 [Protea cynaroides]